MKNWKRWDRIITWVFLGGNFILMYVNWYFAGTRNSIGNLAAMLCSATVVLFMWIGIVARWILESLRGPRHEIYLSDTRSTKGES